MSKDEEEIKYYTDLFMKVCKELNVENGKCEELKAVLIKDIIVAMATQKMTLEGMENTFKMMLQPQPPQGGDIYA